MSNRPVLIPRNKIHFGWIPDLPDHRDLLYAVQRQALEAPISLPPAVNLSGGCPPVYDQGQLGSCTANAIAAAFEFDQMREKSAGSKLAVWTPSRLFIYYNERVLEGTVSSDSGAQIRDGIKSVAKLGVAQESEWPYNIKKFADVPPKKVFQDARQNKATSYLRLSNTDIGQLKTCLAAGYPWVFGITVYTSFMSKAVAQTGKVPMPQYGDNVEGGHAILCVGYDDAAGVFKFRNSWGKTWGDKGYGYLPYQYLTNAQLASDFWTIRTVT